MLFKVFASINCTIKYGSLVKIISATVAVRFNEIMFCHTYLLLHKPVEPLKYTFDQNRNKLKENYSTCLSIAINADHQKYFIERKCHLTFTCRIPLKSYGVLAFLTVATMGLSNTSVGYLNYPTQVIFKCCKLIPVLIGGILIQGNLRCMYNYRILNTLNILYHV